MNRIALTVAVLVLALAPSARADVRYASPAGTGSQCSQAAPCSLNSAVGGAVASDEIVVGPGAYALTAALTPSVPLTIHGVPGAARPRISAPVGSPVIESLVTLHMSDLTLESTDAGGNFRATASLLGDNSTADRVEVIAVSPAGFASALRPGSGFILRDSLVRAKGATGASALFFQAVAPLSTATLRNVTAIASAPADSTALSIFGTAGGPNSSIEATNVIADAGVDATASAAPGIASAIHLANSNFNSSSGTVTGSGNQTPPPVFLNAAGGDFRQAPGSPTIDAGLTDPANGALDLDGNARTVNGKTDIGAYELQPDRSSPKTTIGALRLSRRGVVSATLTCPTSETRCRWRYRLRSAKPVATTSKRRRSKRKVARLGSGRATAPGGGRVTISVRLSSKHLRLIKRLKRLRVKLTVTTTDAAGNRTTGTRAATFKAPKKKGTKRRGG